MSSIRKVTTKRGIAWQARWRERGRARAKNFESKRAASGYAARMAEQVERRGIGDSERLGTAGYLARFVDEVATSGDYSPATVACYARMAALAGRHLAIALSRLTTAAIDDAYAALLGGAKPLRRTTVRMVHRVLVIALNRAVRRGLIAHNPAINATVPGSAKAGGRNRKSEPSRKLRAFSSQEVTALLATAEQDGAPDTLTIISLLLATGLRRAELLGLTLDDVDVDNNLLHVRGTVIEVEGRPVARERGKTAAALRTLALPPTVTTLLRAQRARVQEMMLGAGADYARAPAYLFPGPLGYPMRPYALTRRLKQLMRTAGIVDARAPCHAWRHTSGSLTFDATSNVKLVQSRLGHANAATTMQLYVHPMAEREREAAAHFEALLGANKP